MVTWQPGSRLSKNYLERDDRLLQAGVQVERGRERGEGKVSVNHPYVAKSNIKFMEEEKIDVKCSDGAKINETG